MRRGGLFWGGILIVAGILLLLQNLGLINTNIWGILWPLVLIFIGAQFLLSLTTRRFSSNAQPLYVPLEGTSQAAVILNHGAGILHVDASAKTGSLISGMFDGGVEVEKTDQGFIRRVELKPSYHSFWDFPWSFGYHPGFHWEVGLSPEIPLMLEMKTGASETNLDLSGLKVTDLKLETGASSTQLTFPEAAGFTQARIQTGVAAVSIHVPPTVEARIEIVSGFSGIHVDTGRFFRSENIYESSGYATAANKVNLHIETGMGNVSIS